MNHFADMRSSLPRARDQGQRPTCLAFAVSDAHMLVTGQGGLLSPEYLHFHASKRAAVSLNEAVSVAQIREALRLDGQPLEVACPYSDRRNNSWKPPVQLASLWRHDSNAYSGVPSSLLSHALLAGHCPVLVLEISRSFHYPDPATANILEDGRDEKRYHAVLAVALTGAAGGDAFMVRNSWGDGWGFAGHAWLSSAYVNKRTISILAIGWENTV